jgi:predicted RNase H-like HicB family nuclease
MLLIYPAVIHDDPDGFWAEFPDLEGCTSQGETLQEILSNAKEAMELFVLGLLEDGIAPPNPTRVKNLKNLDENAFPTLIESNIDLAKNTKSVKKTLTIPAWLNERALAKNINFSQVLQEALISKTI